jgi:hypothetical protein
METNQPESSLEREATDENTTGDHLRELAQKSIQLARLVASNASAPADLLQELSDRPDLTVRKYVTANPNTPTRVLLKLCSEFPQQFLQNIVFPLLLLENPNLIAEIPLATLESLLRQESVPVSFIEWTVTNFALNWWSLPVIKVLLAIANNPITPGYILAQLAGHADDEIRWSVALHPHTPKCSLEKLATDKRVMIRYSLAQNPSTPQHILAELAKNESISVRMAVTRNPSTSKRISRTLLS